MRIWVIEGSKHSMLMEMNWLYIVLVVERVLELWVRVMVLFVLIITVPMVTAAVLMAIAVTGLVWRRVGCVDSILLVRVGVGMVKRVMDRVLVEVHRLHIMLIVKLVV